jgi:hypothetical protein
MNPKSFTNHLFANPQKLPFNGTQIQSNHRYPQTPHQGISSPKQSPSQTIHPQLITPKQSPMGTFLFQPCG